MTKAANTTPRIVKLDLTQIRPTQVTVGMAEVNDKRAEWRKQGKRERGKSLTSHVIPGVLGPKGEFHVVDHHHFALALLLEGQEKATGMVQRDFSMLEGNLFWQTMEFYRWAHPYAEHGERLDYMAIPHSLEQMQDDPYRSLAAYVRYKGGYAKDATPYAEFLWADFYRPRIKLRKSRPDADAVKRAVTLARKAAAAYLPGWTGEHEYK